MIRVREIDKYASLRRHGGHGLSWHHLDDVVHVHVVLLDVGREAVRGLLRDEQGVRLGEGGIADYADRKQLWSCRLSTTPVL